RRLNRPVCVHLAGGELVALPDIGYGGGLRWHTRIMDGWTLRRADLVSAASRPMLESLSSLGFAARRIPLGVDLRAWPARAPRPRTAGTRVRLIHGASLNRVKDQ